MTLAAAADRATALFRREGEALRQTALETEWLLTNGLGGFSMGTVLGTPTRRYHGLLIASMHPPIDRINALTTFDERLVIDAGSPTADVVSLTPLHFTGVAEQPRTHPNLVRFERGYFGCRWRYVFETAFGEVSLERMVYLFEGRNAIAVRYAARGHGVPLRLELRPLIRLGDFHELLHEANAPRFRLRSLPNGCVVTDRHLGLHMHSPEAGFTPEPCWWRNLTYWWEADRGQDHVEDLYCPGAFNWTTVPAGGTSVLTVHASIDAMPVGAVEDDAGMRDRRMAELTRKTIVACGGDRLPVQDQQSLAALVRASDAFVVRRGRAVAAGNGGHADAGVSVIAGYPWFADWGRDTMIALPGLFLTTQRFEEARKVLEVFAANRRNGIIPNRFDDRDGSAYYNTVDASLWFVHAACAYAKASGDEGIWSGTIGQACEEVIEAYCRGTDFGIGLDGSDGLIRAGDRTTQLTWMDAKRDSVSFTPRPGKCIEVNALWYSGLLSLAEAMQSIHSGHTAEWRAIAAAAGRSLQTLFWNEREGCLFDRLEPGRDSGAWVGSPEVRPNQLFAVSLPHSALTPVQQRSVVAVVREHLLTPHGLRSLSPRDPGYHGRFEGPLRQRDEAYHNGTVWPWLLGAYFDALVRIDGAKGANEGRRAIQTLVDELDERYVGMLPEVFDGDEPQRPRGCQSQAWSVAEVLRGLATAIRAGG
ncbi:MAG: glycogen debranching enzyme family protein [Phycisphaeraceae bacterium]|nr:glycogen debranching enzyme family protein [Phycisphaeraceae bacterium]